MFLRQAMSQCLHTAPLLMVRKGAAITADGRMLTLGPAIRALGRLCPRLKSGRRRLLLVISLLFLGYLAVSWLLGRQQQRHSLSLTINPRHHQLATANTAAGLVAARNMTPAENHTLLVLYWNDWIYNDFKHSIVNPYCAKSCSATTDKTRVREADAIIFSALATDQIEPPTYRDPRQLWIFFTRESPASRFRSKLSYSRWNGLFNWTMTYRRDSDIYWPYGGDVEKKNADDEAFSFNSSLVLATKKKMAAAVISNCHSRLRRLDYIEKLRTAGIEVDVYGDCGSFKCQLPRNESSECYDEISKNYKFFLAFENSICKDYATEKLFRALGYPWVPVVIGGANYSKIAPPKSVIDATYLSAFDLAPLLKGLDKDEEEYLKFFEWKYHFKIAQNYPWVCQLCEKLQIWMRNPHFKKTYPDLHDWWVLQAQCQHPVGPTL